MWKRRIALALFLIVLAALWGSYNRSSNEGKVVQLTARSVSEVAFYKPSTIQDESDKPCQLTSREIRNAIKNLESHNSSVETVEPTKKMLLDKAKESSECRSKIIKALMKAMDKPNLSFEDSDSHVMWVHGCELLGKLKASEAIDLLIKHMALQWGYVVGGESNQPALYGLLAMGNLALPKLIEVLQRDPDMDKRFWAIFCIGVIGGKEAIRSLKESLEFQTEADIKCAINTALDYFGSEGQLKRSFNWTLTVLKCYE